MKILWRRFLAVIRRDALDREFGEEVASHIAHATDEYVRRGLPLAEARRRARLDFGSANLATDAHRAARGLPWMEALTFELRLMWRGLRRDWTYALASIAMLSLGLALNTTVFTVMDGMLFRGFPFVQENDQLVFLQERDRVGRCCISYTDIAHWQTTARSFQGIAPVGGVSVAFRDGQGRAMDLRVTTVGANLFGLLGVRPAKGRDFTPADARPGARPVVLLSHRLWQARFAGDPDIVGAQVQIDGAPAEIIGVMPEAFEFPLADADGLWMPIIPTPDLLRRGLTPGGFIAAGRLRDGVSLPEARAELEALNRGLEAAYPDTNRGLVPTAVDYAQFTSGADARLIWGSLWAAACLVLLIACANVANLTMVRTVGRWHEFATCLALGAGRPRMIRQMLLESGTVVSAAAVPAWILTRWSVQQWAALAESRYQVVDYTVTAGTLAYLAAVSIAASALLCIAPISNVLHLGVSGTVHGSARVSTHGRGTRRLVTALVSGQVALAVVLLAGAGVLVRSLTNITGAETGVQDPESVLVGRLRLPSETYPTSQSRLTFLDRVSARLITVAGVEQTSMSSGLPVKFSGGLRSIEIEGQPAVLDPGPAAATVTTTGPGYFSVVGAHVIAGRDFTSDDRETTTPVVIINERLAAQFWPGESPIGKRLRTVDPERPGVWRVVVGVASNIMSADALRQEFKPLVYVPMLQEPPARAAFFLARTRGPADRVATAVRTELRALDPDVGIEYFDTLQGTFAFDRDFMDAEHSELGKHSRAALVFAIVALLLAATGLFAVIAHAVAQRTREIGLRLAIGAAPRDIQRMVLIEGLRPVVVGLAIGLVSALAVNRVLQSQLVGVSPSDPLVMVAATTVLVLASLAACRVPVRRALSVDPVVALRHE